MDERKDHLWKVAQEAEERIEDLDEGRLEPHRPRRRHQQGRGRAAQGQGHRDRRAAQRVHPRPLVALHREHPRPERHRLLPRRRRAGHLRHRHRELREHVQRRSAPADGGRPLNPKEQLRHARAGGDPPDPGAQGARRRARSWPSPCPPPPTGTRPQLTYHEATLRRYFESLGYKPVAINEGLAVIFSELEDHNFTGIGISCGGGMCNVTLAYLSIPSHHVQHPQGRRLHRPARWAPSSTSTPRA